MFASQRFEPPRITGDWAVDGPIVLRAISEYLRSLEVPGALAITWGRSSPTWTASANLDGTPASDGEETWIKVDGAVVVCGSVIIDPTAGGACSFTSTLPPILGDLKADTDLNGNVNGVGVGGFAAGAIVGDATNELAFFAVDAPSGDGISLRYIYMYQL